MNVFTYLILFAVIACSSSDLKNSDNPEVVYNEGTRLLEKKHYTEATEYFNELRKKFPQSRFYALAQLKMADLEFDQENFSAAASAYGAFYDLYPTHTESEYAFYKKALSYYKDTPDLVARDQGPAKSAAEAATGYLKKYPTSAHSQDVQKIKLESRYRLAEKHAYIAKFYERREAWSSALERWKVILKDFSDLQDQEIARGLLSEAQKKVSTLSGKI